MNTEDTPIERFLLSQSYGFPLDKAMIVKCPEGGPDVIGCFADIELDVHMVKFGPEGEIEIQTQEMQYVSLSADDCWLLVDMREEADQLWAKLEEFWTDDGEWVGWEHLITIPDKKYRPND